MRRAPTTTLLPASLLLAGLALAGCGSSQPRSTGSLTPDSPSATATPTPTATATPLVSPHATTAGDACTTAQLAVTLGRSGAAAGTSYQALLLRNRSTTTCTLTGYPVIVLLDATGKQVGLSAQPTNVSGAPITKVTLSPGAYANASLGVPDPGNVNGCAPETVTALRISAPGKSDTARVAFQTSACSTSQGRTLVTPVRAGQPSGAVG